LTTQFHKKRPFSATHFSKAIHRIWNPVNSFREMSGIWLKFCIISLFSKLKKYAKGKHYHLCRSARSRNWNFIVLLALLLWLLLLLCSTKACSFLQCVRKGGAECFLFYKKCELCLRNPGKQDKLQKNTASGEINKNKNFHLSPINLVTRFVLLAWLVLFSLNNLMDLSDIQARLRVLCGPGLR